MLLIDLIIFCEIFDRMFEISCVGVGNVSFTLKCAILGVNICLPYIYPLRVNDGIFTSTLILHIG
jgi:hypothetical protein